MCMTKDNKEKHFEIPEPFEREILKSGLYCVATPIGNLRDISLRALDILQSVDIILCEDTRVTRKLLNAYQVKAKLEVYNDHSPEKKRDEVVQRVKSGMAIALVSDAGMPLISDPGYKLIQACYNQDVYVTTIPGANAPLSALQLSGMPSDKFCFLGFMPSKTQSRQAILNEWKDVSATLLFFDTAPRLINSMKDVLHIMGEREVAVVREITKLYEEVQRDTASNLIAHYEQAGRPKGEIVLVIEPAKLREFDDKQLDTLLDEALETMRVKDAAQHVAQLSGRKKSDLYNMALKRLKFKEEK